jgi:hypothetical protein
MVAAAACCKPDRESFAPLLPSSRGGGSGVGAVISPSSAAKDLSARLPPWNYAQRQAEGPGQADILLAHLNWASALAEGDALRPRLTGPRSRSSRSRRVNMVLFSDLVRIDRLGRGRRRADLTRSAPVRATQFAGLYNTYRSEDVHGFFQSMSVVHRAFQDSEVHVRGWASARGACDRPATASSPVFCTSSAGHRKRCD